MHATNKANKALCAPIAVAAAAAVAGFAQPSGRAGGFPGFELHEIGTPGGSNLGQTSLVDMDGDGDLDFVSGARQGKVWWFEHEGPDQWTAHEIGDRALTDVGGVAFDVDGDGDIDQVSGGTLYLNDGKQSFTRHEIGTISCHDNRTADVNGDGRPDLLAQSDRSGVFWYEVPEDPTAKWIEHRICDARHSGLATGDIDGDGDLDVVRGDWWIENVDGKGTSWKEHHNIPFPGTRYNFAGMAPQTAVADIDGDGDLDLAMTDGETDKAKAAWIENLDGKGGEWKLHLLGEGFGALHSVALEDFDGDGDFDFFTCEMGIGGSGRWMIWENPGGEKARIEEWKRHTILEGVVGHETRVGDVDGDGDPDLCSKPWNGDRHVYLRNMRIERAAEEGNNRQQP